MERCSGFKVVFFPDEEWGGVVVVVAVVKDLEMRSVGDWKSRRVGVVVVVVVVLSSILRGSLFFLPQVTTNEERGTTNDLCLPACLLVILRKKLILNKSQFTQDNLLGRDGVQLACLGYKGWLSGQRPAATFVSGRELLPNQ